MVTENGNKQTLKEELDKIWEKQVGGQNALQGYHYQELYSCYLVLSDSDENTKFRLEGIEDIDCIKTLENNISIPTYIQVKQYKKAPSPSKLKDVIQNFLKIYLVDKSSYFKLVYHFPVESNKLKKLFNSELDQESCKYWKDMISQIQGEHPDWNWSNYTFEEFLNKLKFEKHEPSVLEEGIEKVLIEKYEIETDNIILFKESLLKLCNKKMTERGEITDHDLTYHILKIKDEISKGSLNPAHSWIRGLNFPEPNPNLDSTLSFGFLEGKKPTPSDIVNGLPIPRPKLEGEVLKSIKDHRVTVIKASSGQGKTTLAWQAAYKLQNTYTLYQLLTCDDRHELGNIIQFFKAKMELGEKPLIILDNLNGELDKWSQLVQSMESELTGHYKFLITARETDWYFYSGDISTIHSLHIIKPVLDEKEASAIFKS